MKEELKTEQKKTFSSVDAEYKIGEAYKRGA